MSLKKAMSQFPTNNNRTLELTLQRSFSLTKKENPKKQMSRNQPFSVVYYPLCKETKKWQKKALKQACKIRTTWGKKIKGGCLIFSVLTPTICWCLRG